MDAETIREVIREEFKTALSQGTKEAIKEHLQEFYIERERHYLDHKFIGDVREGAAKIRGTACTVVTKTLMAAAFVALGLGIVAWARHTWSIFSGGKQ